MSGEGQGNPAARPKATPYFLQSSNRIGPDLHRVNGKGYVEERVFEREQVRRRQAKVEVARQPKPRCSSRGLGSASPSSIGPADESGSARQSLGQPGPGAASDLEYACAGLDAGKIDDRCGRGSCGPSPIRRASPAGHVVARKRASKSCWRQLLTPVAFGRRPVAIER